MIKLWGISSSQRNVLTLLGRNIFQSSQWTRTHMYHTHTSTFYENDVSHINVISLSWSEYLDSILSDDYHPTGKSHLLTYRELRLVAAERPHQTPQSRPAVTWGWVIIHFGLSSLIGTPWLTQLHVTYLHAESKYNWMLCQLTSLCYDALEITLKLAFSIYLPLVTGAKELCRSMP